MSVPLTLWPDDEPRVRASDPLTSHAAADTNDTAGSRRAVWLILAAMGKPLADHEIKRIHESASPTPYTEQRLRTARHELQERGVVVEDGTAVTPRGRKCLTWRLAS